MTFKSLKCFFLLLTAVFASKNEFLPKAKKYACIAGLGLCLTAYTYNQFSSTSPSTWNYDNTMEHMCAIDQNNNLYASNTGTQNHVMNAIIGGVCTQVNAGQVLSALRNTCQGAYDKTQTLKEWLKTKRCPDSESLKQNENKINVRKASGQTLNQDGIDWKCDDGTLPNANGCCGTDPNDGNIIGHRVINDSITVSNGNYEGGVIVNDGKSEGARCPAHCKDRTIKISNNVKSCNCGGCERNAGRKVHETVIQKKQNQAQTKESRKECKTRCNQQSAVNPECKPKNCTN